MASQAQINPDSLNSQPGAPSESAPLTYEAKAAFCTKRITPGFNTSIIYIPLEYKKDFVELLYALITQYNPATVTEQILLEKMANHQWLSLRATRFQSIVLRNNIKNGVIDQNLGVLIRYQTTADRGFYRALSELLKLQKERQKSEIGFESQKTQPPAAIPAEVPAESPQIPPKSAPPEPPKAPSIAVPVVATVPTPEISSETSDEMLAAVREVPPGRKKAA